MRSAPPSPQVALLVPVQCPEPVVQAKQAGLGDCGKEKGVVCDPAGPAPETCPNRPGKWARDSGACWKGQSSRGIRGEAGRGGGRVTRPREDPGWRPGRLTTSRKPKYQSHPFHPPSALPSASIRARGHLGAWISPDSNPLNPDPPQTWRLGPLG